MFYLLKKKKSVLIHDGEPNLGGRGEGVEFPGSPPGARQQANLQGIC